MDSLGLADVLPGVAHTLGVGAQGALTWPAARSAVVVLVDGLGHELLQRRLGHAPFLRSVGDHMTAVPCGFPSTTATSMATFGVGVGSGEHGMLGYEVFDPERDTVFNQLSWEDGPVPETWQSRPTVFEQVADAGIEVTRIGPAFFDGSGLTRAALRGGRFVGAESLQERVDEAVAAIRASARALVYLYWGELDKVGHLHGCESPQWCDELESVDRALAQLSARLPADCSLTVTADHGMVDVRPEDRVDVATTPGLPDGVRHVFGEPRALQLRCEPGAVDDVAATWRGVLGDRVEVLDRPEAVLRGLFGPVDRRMLNRIGDLVVLARTRCVVVDSRRHRPQLVNLIGVHGSTSPDEVNIPLLHLPAGLT